MNTPNLTEPTNLMNTSFTITWTITNPNNIRSYKITWTNLHNSDVDNVEVQGNTTSYTVTGLNGVDNYNVSVAAENKCGIMESDPMTIYGKDVLCTYLKLSSIIMIPNLVKFITTDLVPYAFTNTLYIAVQSVYSDFFIGEYWLKIYRCHC